MRYLDLEIEGVTAKARLLEDEAPKTCQSLWDVLPFESLATHSRWSGSRLHTKNHPKLKLGKVNYPFIENPSAYQSPGDVCIWPLNNEITVNYGPGDFKYMDHPWLMTHVATIEEDMEQFASKIERLQWEGAKKLVISRSTKAPRASKRTEKSGSMIQIQCEGKHWVAELYEDKAPEICKAVLASLPMEGPITNTHGSGDLLHFWARVRNAPAVEKKEREARPIEYKGKQVGISYIAYYEKREMRGLMPGDLFLHSMGDIRLVHGQAFQGSMPAKFGRIVQGDIKALHTIAERVELEGAKTMTITKLT